MLPLCARCGAALPVDRLIRFCGSCGLAVPEDPGDESQALEEAPAPPAEVRVQLSVDTETLRHFAVGTRCMVRLRIHNQSAIPFDSASIYADVLGGDRLAPAHTDLLPAGHSAVLPLWFVPNVAGFFELRGVMHLTSASEQAPEAGKAAPGFFRFDSVQFRVGTATEAQRVSVVNIDQRSARVVDNSRTQFAVPSEDRGGLVGDGAFHPVTLRPITSAEAAALRSELARYVPRTAENPALSPASQSHPVPTLGMHPGASARFTVKAENAQYEVESILAQGEIATLYNGRRQSDGAPVVVKIADDKLDNDLIQAEVSALNLLRSQSNPKSAHFLKHLPVVLDQLHTRDGRLGTVFEYLDGLDLTKVRERLPQGLPSRHLIWVMRRALNVLGFAHACGVLHGNLDPAHIVIRAHDHNVWLIDWCYAIVNPAQTGQGFRCANEGYGPPEAASRRPPLPSSDLYSLGKCMFYALGGDPQEKTLPASTPEDPDGIDERIQRFLQFCVMESPLSRAQDAWDAYHYLERLRKDIWGPHRFIELVL